MTDVVGIPLALYREIVKHNEAVDEAIISIKVYKSASVYYSTRNRDGSGLRIIGTFVVINGPNIVGS